MATLKDMNGLVDDNLMYMYGLNSHQDQETHVTVAYNTTDLVIYVNDATILSRGLIEVGEELMQATGVDSAAGSLTIAPYGRGYRGTTAATGSIGDRLVSSPLVPRSMMVSAMNETIRAVWPDVHATGNTTITTGSANTYELPTGALGVTNVSYESRGNSLEWIPARRYRVDIHGNQTAFATGNTITLYDGVPTGTKVHISYTKEPDDMGSDLSLGFSAVTGLPDSCIDVIRYGAAYRLSSMLDSPKIVGTNAEADWMSNNKQGGSGQKFGSFMFQLYQARLAVETAKQQRKFPDRSRYTR